MNTFCEVLESRTFLSATPTPTQVEALQLLTDAQATLATERSTRVSTLAADRAAIPAAREADQLLITADLTKVRTDRGNPSLVLADELQLRTDRAQLLLDVHTDTVQLLSDTRSTNQEILADTRAVTIARLEYLRDVRLHL